MKPITHYLFVIGLFLFVQSVNGQITTSFSPAAPSVQAGQTVALQLRVTGFTNIATTQLTIAFNKSILKFDSLSNSILPGFTSGNVSPDSVANKDGKVKISWFADQILYPNGFTANANTAIFTLYFKGLANGTSTVNLTSSSPGTEAYNANLQPVPVNFSTGASNVTISGGTTPLVGFKVIANDLEIKQGATACMPVTVNDFDGIVALSYSMSFNPALLDYETTQAHNLPTLSATSFLESVIAPGNIVMTWDDPTAAGVTRADGAKIYEVCFKAIGAVGSCAEIDFGFKGFPPTGGTTPQANKVNGDNVWTTPVKANICIIPNVPAPQLIADSDTIPQNQQTCVDVKVKNFTDISSVQFGLTFDQTKIQYQSVQLGANPLGLSMGNNFTVSGVASGNMAFTWTDDTAPIGVDLADNTSLFSVCFMAVGTANTQSAVTFGTVGNTQVEVVRDPGGAVTPTLTNGLVRILQAIPVVVTPAPTSPTCPGGNNGSISTTIANCPGATYNWSGPSFTSTLQNPTGLRAGTYSVTCTCTNGQTATATVQVQDKPAITLSQNVTNPTCNNGNNGSITITPNGGSGGFKNYQWTLNSQQVGTTQNISNLASGAYTVSLADANNCPFTSAPIVVTNPPAIAVNPSTTNPACPANSGQGSFSGAINISPTNGKTPYTFMWTGPNNYSNSQEDISSLGSGQYTVKITDANNCSVTSSPITLNAPAAINVIQTVTNPACPGSSTGSISVTTSGGTPGYTYSWAGPGGATYSSQNLQSLATGGYRLTITDQNSCTASFGPYDLTAAPAMQPSVVTSNVKCFGANDGSINLSVVNGTAPYTYMWSNSATVEDPSNLQPGQYSVTIRDVNNCTVTLTAPASIQGPANALTVTETVTNATCPNGTGAISISANGGWGNPNFVWSGGLPSVPNQNGIAPGNYSVTISDAGNCSIVKNLSVGAPAQIASSQAANVVNPTCAGANNGAITIFPTGGTAPLLIDWNTGLKGLSISGLAPGTYTPTITDAMGCTALLTPPTFTLTAPPAIVIVETITAIGPGNGGVSLVVSLSDNSTGNYTYSWTGPNNFTANTSSISVINPGLYTVKITEASQPNCPVEKTYNVTANNVWPQTVMLPTTPACSNDGCVNLLMPPGAQAPFTVTIGAQTYPINNVIDTISICGLPAGNWPVTIAGGGFSHTFPVNALIQQKALPVFGYTSVDPNDGLSNGSIKIESNDPNAYSYKWSTGQTTATINGLDKGIYTVTVTNIASGCTKVQTIELDYPPASIILTSSTIKQPSCLGKADGSISLFITGGDLPLSYQWSGPNGFTSNLPNLTGLAAGQYCVTINEADGATVPTQCITLTNQSNLASTVTVLSNYGQYQTTGACDGIATVTFTGQAPGLVNILWNNNVIANTNTMLCGGNFSVTVTDAVGCTSVGSGTVTAPPALASQVIVDTTLFHGYAISCFGQCDGEGGVRINGGIPPYRIEWPTGPIETVQQSGGISSRVNLCAGSYFVTITDRGGQGVAQIVEIPITEPDELTADFAFIAPQTFRTCDGEMVIELNGAVGAVDYSWYSDFGRAGDTLRAANLCPNEVVTFIVVDENGCRNLFTQQVPFPPDGCFQVSPVLTPGELDGKNDWIEITCITESPENTVEIFNRWGQMVYKASGYDNASTRWDGLSSNGEPLAAGVYYYVVTYNDIDTNEPRQIKGHINLLR